MPSLRDFGYAWELVSDYEIQDVVETHQITRSSATTVVVDQSGTGTTGTFIIDISGTAHMTDAATATGSGLDVTGSLAADISFRTVIQGRRTPDGDVVDSQTYTETGSAYSGQTFVMTFPSASFTAEVDNDHTWELSWSGARVGGAWSVTSYAYSDEKVNNFHELWNYFGNSAIAFDIDTGYEMTVTGNGDGTAESDTRQWEHTVKNSAYTLNPGANSVEYGGLGEWTGGGTVALDFGPTAQTVEWMASSPDSINFTWRGETSSEEELTQTAVYGPDGGLSVPAFTTETTTDYAGHLIEDVPSESDGGGAENYHRDETTTVTRTATGSGQYGASTSANYRVVETVTTDADNTLTVTGDESSGVDESGEEYDLVFNAVVDRVSHSELTTTEDYYDAGEGLVLVDETADGSNGATLTSRHWGTRNGVAFDETTTYGDSDTVSESDGMDDPVDTGDWLPDDYDMGETYFISADVPEVPQPRMSQVRGVRGTPQDLYNDQVLKYSEDAAEQVVNAWFRKMVMERLRNPGNQAALLPGAGTFTIEAKGQTATAWTEDGTKMDDAMKNHKKGFAKLEYTNINLVSVDVIVTYAVDGANQPFRSGKCVVSYRTICNYTVKDKNGVTRSVQREGVSGIALFQDENLKGMQFAP